MTLTRVLWELLGLVGSFAIGLSLSVLLRRWWYRREKKLTRRRPMLISTNITVRGKPGAVYDIPAGSIVYTADGAKLRVQQGRIVMPESGEATITVVEFREDK